MKTIDEREMQKTTKEKQTKTERSKGNRSYSENFTITLMMIMQPRRAGEGNTTYHVTPNTYVTLVKLQYMSIYGQILRQFLPTWFT